MGLNMKEQKDKAKKSKGTFVKMKPTRTTIFLDIGKRDALKLLAAQRKVTMTSLLDEGFDMVLKKYL